MLSLARRVSGHCPCSNRSILNKMTRLARRGLADKPPDSSGTGETSGTSAPSVVGGPSGSIEETKASMTKVLFSSEEKELMQTLEQKIPFTVEREPGVYCYENAVRPLVTFPDPTVGNLEIHEEIREYSLGYPVVRPPHPVDRIKETLRLKKSSPKDYPWIQEFRSHYDYLIIGGGIVGSCIANFLAERIKVTDGYRIGIIEKDPTYRRSNSTQLLGGLRTQFSAPESIESGLFAADYLRMSHINIAVPMDHDEAEGFFNVPNIKLQPHGHLTLVTEEQVDKLESSHDRQGLAGAHTAIVSKRSLEKRFPWLNTNGIAAGCLGLESEGWFDTWNFLQSLILRNKYLGVEYIHGEAMFMKKHGASKIRDNTFRNYEVHCFLPDSKQVYPIEFSNVIIAAAGQSGNVGRMAGIGVGKGPLYMDIPVEPRRGYIFEVKCPDGPGLRFPMVSDPSGLFVRRDGYLGHYLVGKLPNPDDMEEKIPENIFGDVDPEYWEQEILPLLQYRIPAFKDFTLMGSRRVDYDLNYVDGCPVVGQHPLLGNVFMATGFNGRGAMYGPAVGRAIMELMLDDGYKTIDFSRFSFDRFLNRVEVKEELYA